MWLIEYSLCAVRQSRKRNGEESLSVLDERDGLARSYAFFRSPRLPYKGRSVNPDHRFHSRRCNRFRCDARQGRSLDLRCRQIAAGRSFRLVIWSLPADRVVLRIRADVQLKITYSDTESYYLARTLPSVTPGTPVSLVGYSLGCRIAGGALQLLAGGQAGGRRLSPGDAAWTTGTLRRAIFVPGQYSL